MNSSHQYPVLVGPALVAAAEQLMLEAHDGQYRADKVTPYSDHPYAVKANFIKEVERISLYHGTYYPQYGVPAPFVHEDFYRGQALALVHDTKEPDAARQMGDEDIRGVGLGSILPELDLLTKFDGESYLDYLLHLKESRNTVALLVKRADMEANLADVHRVPSAGARKGLRVKYELARYIITH